tara:strand:- start:325 stop:1512 length:1188 start_codon:yes stop_codon:yes gene_type:complete
MKILIVGCGIGGLNIGYKLLLNGYKVDLIDKNNYVGGRIHTIKGNNYQIESGGARFNNNHKKLLKLIKEFNLTKIKLSKKVVYKPSYKINDNNNYLEIVLKKMNKIKTNILQKYTFYELAEKCIGKEKSKIMLDKFAYYCEMKIMNAYDSKKSLEEDLNDNLDFYIIQEGLSELCKRMCFGIKKLNGKIYLKSYLKNVYEQNNKYICDINGKDKTYDSIILCCGKDTLLKMNILSSIKKQLNSVSCQPLFRIYAKYPLKNNKVWFQDLHRVKTNRMLKYIIPIDYKNGIIMISYTDGIYAKNIIKEDNIEEKIENQVKVLFPELDIPKPIWYKFYYWNNGICYWKKGVDSNKLYNEILQPIKNKKIYIGGENYSKRQGWVEGALETTDQILNDFY